MSRLAFLSLIVAISIWPVSASSNVAPRLGSAASYAILAGTTVTNTGPSDVTGDLGVSAGTAVTGFPPGILHGTQRTGDDPAAILSKVDLAQAYSDAASEECTSDLTGQNLGGMTLVPGVYCQTTAPTLTGTMTLQGEGLYIFKIGSTLVTAPGAVVRLTNGAAACDVYWQVGSSATLDTTTRMVGTIMAYADINIADSVYLVGRALAKTGQVTLINDTIFNQCEEVQPTPSETPSPTPSATPSPTPTPEATPTPSQPESTPRPTVTPVPTPVVTTLPRITLPLISSSPGPTPTLSPARLGHTGGGLPWTLVLMVLGFAIAGAGFILRFKE